MKTTKASGRYHTKAVRLSILAAKLKNLGSIHVKGFMLQIVEKTLADAFHMGFNDSSTGSEQSFLRSSNQLLHA